jgi:putative ABC transport system permease protein
VLGSKPRQIAGSYLLEAAVLTGAGLVVALGLVSLAAPAVGAAIGIDLRGSRFDGGFKAAAFYGALLLGVSVAAGAYPAFLLARLPPVSMLRSATARGSPSRLWSLLLAAQFAVASFLSIAAVVTFQQNAALRAAAREGDDRVVVIENLYTATKLHPDTLAKELLRLPQVVGVTSMSSAPWSGLNVLPLGTSSGEAATPRSALWRTVGYDYFAVFDIALVAGRVFDPARGEDALPFFYDGGQPNSIVISRSLVDELNFGSPELALEHVVYVPKRLLAGFGAAAAQPLRIIGVVEDKPLTLVGVGPRSSVYSFAEPLPYQAVRITPDDVAGTLARIDALWSGLVPNVAIHRRLTDEIFAERYRNLERIHRSFSALAAFALLIAAVGLFAMAAVLTARRRYEIAVRKAFGAGTGRIALLLLGAFAKPVVAGTAMAWPAAYLAARAYLEAFVAPIALTPAPFALCLAATLLIVVATIGAQTLRAASASPDAALHDH